jgi:hypothetical protein
MADRVDATMDRVQSPARDPALDRSAAEPERNELAAGDDAVLACRELRDRSLVWARRSPACASHAPTCATFALHLMVDVSQVGHRREDDR